MKFAREHIGFVKANQGPKNQTGQIPVYRIRWIDTAKNMNYVAKRKKAASI